VDRPPAHHPECDCDVDELDGRVISSANTLIEFASDVATGHELCSYNMLVAAYLVVEFMREMCETKEGSNTDTVAQEVAKKFYEYSSSKWGSSKKRNLN
jgi:hypothetical protein